MKRALANLVYGVQARKGFSSFCRGEVGTGKTTISLNVSATTWNSAVHRIRVHLQLSASTLNSSSR